jgi:endonuclease YncB( thermonuclease family)
LAVAWYASADTLVDLVVGVQDGDPLTILDSGTVQHKVRLSGRDAPETGQPWGQRSKEGLSALAYRRQAAVEWQECDRYGRLVGKVLVEGRDLNLAQVSSGLAWHYTKYATEQQPVDRQLYADAQAGAMRQRVGLWQDPAPTAPWDYRQAKRTPPSAGVEPLSRH